MGLSFFCVPWYWAPGRAVLRMAFVILWVHVFVEFMAIDLLKFAKAPGPSGDRGDMPLMATWG